MKRFVKNILNEARVQRTIDPKIWASMSSMSSRLRSTLGEDAKVMKKDDMNTLLQKYVAGLLTMKVACPNNVSEIDDIRAYKQIGQAYINAGGTISDIQKLYVENGGELSGNVSATTVNNIQDEPMDHPDELDVVTDEIINNEIDDIDDTDIELHDEPVEDIPVNEPTIQKPVSKKLELSNTQRYINTYIKRNREILAASAGQVLAFDETTGTFRIEDNSVELYPICTGRGFSNVDKRTRFYVVGNTDYSLGNAGNNGVYDDYYFKKSESSNGKLQIKAGSNYYMDEPTKGKFYTEILADNGMNAAIHIADNIDEVDIHDPNAIQILKVSAYLPTLPELAVISSELPAGVYWTSSVTNDGKSNIALQVKPDKVLMNCQSAKTVTFIRFD